mgnify:CR=1 FL=1
MLNYIFKTFFDRKTKVLIFISMLIFLPLFFLVYSPNFTDKDVFLKQSEKTTQIFQDFDPAKIPDVVFTKAYLEKIN